MVSKGALVEEAELSLPAAPRPWGTRVSAVHSHLLVSCGPEGFFRDPLHSPRLGKIKVNFWRLRLEYVASLTGF